MSEDDPAGISATTLKVRGDADVALATSFAITAKPSTDELSKGGRSDEMMSAASTRPAQAWREDISVSTGLKWERMRCCASCTLSRLMAKAGALYHALYVDYGAVNQIGDASSPGPSVKLSLISSISIHNVEMRLAAVPAEANTIYFPSGDQEGAISWDKGSFDKSIRLVPSAFTT